MWCTRPGLQPGPQQCSIHYKSPLTAATARCYMYSQGSLQPLGRPLGRLSVRSDSHSTT